MGEERRLFSISLLYKHPIDEERAPIYISHVNSLSQVSFWARGSVKEALVFVGREVTQRTGKSQRQTIDHLEYRCHCFVGSKDIAVAIVSTLDYPHRIAHVLIDEILETFYESDYFQENKRKFCVQQRDLNFKGMNQFIEAKLHEYQVPEEVDRILMIQNELDTIREIVLSNLTKLVEREGNLQTLIDKTNDLTVHTKYMADRTGDLNKCCTLL